MKSDRWGNFGVYLSHFEQVPSVHARSCLLLEESTSWRFCARNEEELTQGDCHIEPSKTRIRFKVNTDSLSCVKGSGRDAQPLHQYRYPSM